MVSDDPNEKIILKMFHEEIKGFNDIPMVRELKTQQVTDNYYQVKQDIQVLIEQEMYKLKIQEDEIEEF